MYRIIANDGTRLVGGTFPTFIEAFKLQQKRFRNGYIIFKTKHNMQIVWNPMWEDLDCSKLR